MSLPDVPQHAPIISSAPKKKPTANETGELTMEKPKSKPIKADDEEVKAKLESSLQVGIDNPEIKKNPMKVLQGLHAPSEEPLTADQAEGIKETVGKLMYS
jgi:hypothetical protein